MVSFSMNLFFGLTTTVSASKATGSSMYSMPACLQAAISFSRMGREALAISISPRQNFLKPPPVPEMPTVTRTLPRLAIWNSSATASVTGNTVLEPSNLTIGVLCACAVCAPASPTNRAATAAAALIRFIKVSCCRAYTTMPRSLGTECFRIITAGRTASGGQRPLHALGHFPGEGLHLGAVLPLDHDAQHRLRAGSAQQQPAALAQPGFHVGTGPLDGAIGL